jgi:hypothetical protein
MPSKNAPKPGGRDWQHGFLDSGAGINAPMRCLMFAFAPMKVVAPPGEACATLQRIIDAGRVGTNPGRPREICGHQQCFN